jgi:hypothetical protein
MRGEGAIEELSDRLCLQSIRLGPAGLTQIESHAMLVTAL